jgi:hypothetical protein
VDVATRILEVAKKWLKEQEVVVRRLRDAQQKAASEAVAKMRNEKQEHTPHALPFSRFNLEKARQAAIARV